MDLDKSQRLIDQQVPSRNPFADRQPSGFQFSMGTLLVIMVVVSVMSASLLWASRLPVVTNEIHQWLGTIPAENSDGTDRGSQLVFLLFCYSAPLLIAGTLNCILLLIKYLQPRLRSVEETEEEF